MYFPDYDPSRIFLLSLEMSWICVKLKFLELCRLEGPGIIYLLLKAGPLIAGCSGPCSKEFQGWRSHNLSVLDFDHPHGCRRRSNKLVSSCNFSCSHLHTCIFCLSSYPWPLSRWAWPTRKLQDSRRIPYLSSSSSMPNKPQSLILSSYVTCSSLWPVWWPCAGLTLVCQPLFFSRCGASPK